MKKNTAAALLGDLLRSCATDRGPQFPDYLLEDVIAAAGPDAGSLLRNCLGQFSVFKEGEERFSRITSAWINADPAAVGLLYDEAMDPRRPARLRHRCWVAIRDTQDKLFRGVLEDAALRMLCEEEDTGLLLEAIRMASTAPITDGYIAARAAISRLQYSTYPCIRAAACPLVRQAFGCKVLCRSLADQDPQVRLAVIRVALPDLTALGRDDEEAQALVSKMRDMLRDFLTSRQTEERIEAVRLIDPRTRGVLPALRRLSKSDPDLCVRAQAVSKLLRHDRSQGR